MTSAAGGRDADRPLYPLDRSFVVQIERGCQVGDERLSGRIEHVSTGETVAFDDCQALLSFIQSILGGTEPLP